MKHPSQEDLLGYVLGALDAQEHRDLQQVIDQNPELEEQLLQIKTSLMPLDALDTAGPRTGLARRTCEAVASWQKQQDLIEPPKFTDLSALAGSVEQISTTGVQLNDVGPDGQELSEAQNLDAATEPVPVSSEPKIRPAISERIFHPTTWSIPDVLVGMAVLMICAGILFPTINYTRNASRIYACQDNLRKVGVAMMNYSSIHEGNFVPIPLTGNLSASGCYAPVLKDAGLVEDDSVFSCAGVAASKSVNIPSCDQVAASECEKEIDHYRRTMGGHFGYTMGYLENNKYCSPRYKGRLNVVLLADQPSSDLPGRRSANHNGSGQNCLFEDGRVVFVKGHAYGGDALFENDYGIVAPGSHERDNVIAPSHLSVQTGSWVSRN